MLPNEILLTIIPFLHDDWQTLQRFLSVCKIPHVKLITKKYEHWWYRLYGATYTACIRDLQFGFIEVSDFSFMPCIKRLHRGMYCVDYRKVKRSLKVMSFSRTISKKMAEWEQLEIDTVPSIREI